MNNKIDKFNVEDEKNLANQFDKNMDKLKWWNDISWNQISNELKNLKSFIEESIDEQEELKDLEKSFDDKGSEINKDKVDIFFDEIDNINKNTDRKIVKKYKKIKDRWFDVKEKIVEASDVIIGFVKNWDKEKNPVAKVLLRIADWILRSEKPEK